MGAGRVSGRLQCRAQLAGDRGILRLERDDIEVAEQEDAPPLH
jgi:hypothetical protein